MDGGPSHDGDLDCGGLDGSEGGKLGEGQKSEWRGDVGLVDTVSLEKSVEVELTDSVSLDLVRYEA